jgi:hypothetical protein
MEEKNNEVQPQLITQEELFEMVETEEGYAYDDELVEEIEDNFDSDDIYDESDYDKGDFDDLEEDIFEGDDLDEDW